MDDRLHKFARLAETGSFTKAALELHISQPALSMAIQKLELELGTALLVKNGKRLELTAAGKVAYQAALDQHDVTTHLHESLARLARKRPIVKLGMVDSVADKVCSTTAFDQLESQADVTIIVNNSRYLRNSVERRQVDLALIIQDDLEHQGLTSQWIGEERLQLVFHPKLTEAVMSSLEKGQLRDFISYDKPSTTYRHIQNHFTAIGIHTQTRLFSTSPSVMLTMVLQGKGCAVLPQHMVDELLRSQQLATTLEPVVRPISGVTVNNKVLPAYLQTFLAEASDVLQNQC